jgi:hypothetical protein
VGTLQPQEVERALCQLRGVEAARVCWDQGAIAEVHVAAAPGTRPKHVARDVRSYLAAALGIEVDHKKISIATRKPGDDGAADDDGAAREVRARLGALQLQVEGAAAEAQVTLAMAGRAVRGASAPHAGPGGSERAVLAAVVDALQQVVRRDVRLMPGEVRRLRVGGRGVRVAEVIVLRGGESQALFGACAVAGETHRAVALAALHATNRVLCRLMPLRWLEIRVDPDGGGDEGGEGA